MATITAPVDQAYISGNVALSLNAGDLAVICAFWQWDTNAAYEISSGTISVDATPLSGYYQQIKGDDSTSGCYMGIAPYVATATGSVNISLSPTDPGASRVIRLQVIKIVPSGGAHFIAGYLIDDANQTRLAGGSGTLSLSNLVGDYLIGMCYAGNTGAAVVSWTAPATEQTDVVDVREFSTGTQTSEETNDTLVWNVSSGVYHGGVGIAVRETSGSGGSYTQMEDE